MRATRRIALYLFVALANVCTCGGAIPVYVQRTLVDAPGGIVDFVGDSAGNVLVSDGNDAVLKFDHDGVQVRMPTPMSGLIQPRALALDAQGNIYVATTFEILKFDATGAPIPFANSVPNYNYAGMAVDSHGNIILASEIEVVRYAPDGTSLPFTTPITGLSQNYSVAVDANDNIYATTVSFGPGSPSVLKFAPEGSPVPLAHPIVEPNTESVGVDSVGAIYTVDLIITPTAATYLINKYDSTGAPLPYQHVITSPLALKGSSNGILATDSRELYRLASNGAELPFAHPIVSPCMPYGIAFNHQGDMFVSNFCGRILKYDANGLTLPLAHRIEGLIQPEGLAIDAQDNLYVAQYGTAFNTGMTGPNAIYRFDPTGLPLPFDHAIDQLNGPAGVAITSDGNILVAQIQGNEVLRFDAHGTPLPFASRVLGTSGFWGITIDGANNFYVTEGSYDIQPHQVRKFSASGGQLNFQYPISGLYAPTGIALDASQNLFVSSWGGSTSPPQNTFLQEFAPNGMPVPITINGLRTGTWGTAAINHGFIYLPNLAGTIDVMLPDVIFGSGFQ